MSGYLVSAGSSYQWVKKIVASTSGDGVLKLTLKGDPEVSQCQFNQAEVLIFTDDVGLTDRLIEAINTAATEPAQKVFA